MRCRLCKNDSDYALNYHCAKIMQNDYAKYMHLASPLPAKRPAFGNLANLPMSAPLPPSSDTSSSRGSSLSSYAARAPAPRPPPADLSARPPINGQTNHSFVMSCPLHYRQAAAFHLPFSSGSSDSAASTQPAPGLGAHPPVPPLPSPALCILMRPLPAKLGRRSGAKQH
jgi:hypothetical protein